MATTDRNVAAPSACLAIHLAGPDRDQEFSSARNAVTRASGDEPIERLRPVLAFEELSDVAQETGASYSIVSLRALAEQERSARAAAFLLGTPLLSDDPLAGLNRPGVDCSETEK